MRKWLASALLLSVAIALFLASRSPSRFPIPPVNSADSAVSRGAAASSITSAKVAQPAAAAKEDSAPLASVRATTSPIPQPAVPAHVDALPQELVEMAPETALENMRTVIRQYGSMFSGNPVGTNLEITQELQGENPKHINFLSVDGNRVNSQGELVDLWGTPYFFHQISGTETEIRSAGPDRVMYTGDDLVIK
jgi:hypothetical protein